MPRIDAGLLGPRFSSASSAALAFKVSTDSQYRINVDAGGTITWGDGSTSGDTNLYRASANLLKTDDVFQAASGVITLAYAGTPVASLADGALAVDTTNNKFYFRSGSTWREVTGGSATVTGVLTFTVSGSLITGTGQSRWYAPDALTINNVLVSVGTAPTGSSLIFDVNKNGTTVFTTQANRPTITASSNTDLTSAPDVTSLSAGDYLTIDIDQIGSTVAGANAVVQIKYTLV